MLSRGFVIFDVGFLILPAVAGRGLLTQRPPRTQRSEKGEFVIFDFGFLILPAVAGYGRAYACKAPTPAPTLVGAGRGRVAKLGKGRGEGIRPVGTMVGSFLVGRTEFLHCLEIRRIQGDVAHVLKYCTTNTCKKTIPKKTGRY